MQTYTIHTSRVGYELGAVNPAHTHKYMHTYIYENIHTYTYTCIHTSRVGNELGAVNPAQTQIHTYIHI
jgi:hypothetical protein